MAQGEDVVADAAAVRVMNRDVEIGMVVEQPVDNMRGFTGGRRQKLGMERCEAVRDVGVDRDGRVAAIPCVDGTDRLPRPANVKVLPVRAGDGARAESRGQRLAMLGVDDHRQRLGVGFLAKMPTGRPGEPAIARDAAGVGHAGQAEVGGIGQCGREHDTAVVGGQAGVQMPESRAEVRPTIDLGQELGDTHAWHHPVEPLGQMLGSLRRHRLQWRDAQGSTGDADVLETVGERMGVDLVEALLEQRAPALEVGVDIARHRDRQRAGLVHRGEKRPGDELVLDGFELPAAFDPDVPGTQSVAQLGEQAQLVSPAIDAGVGGDGLPPCPSKKAGGYVPRPTPAPARIKAPHDLDGAQEAGGGRNSLESERLQERRADGSDTRDSPCP